MEADPNKRILEEIKQIKQLLLDLNMNNKEMLNFKEACLFLDLSASYLYKLTSRGDIPYYKPHGKKNYFQREELFNWMKRNRVCTNKELKEIAIKKDTNIYEL